MSTVLQRCNCPGYVNVSAKSTDMHEFSIALNIIEIAESTASQHKATAVSEVELEVGDASGVNIEALEFAWESATFSSSLLKKSKLRINPVSLLVRCNSCQYKFPPADLFEKCPACGENGTTIMQGRELKVKSVMLDDF